MICRPDKNAVIRLNYDAMSTNNAVSRPQIRGRSRPFRSLFVAVAGALILTGFIVPRANATNLLTYYNFNHEADGAFPPYSSNITDVPFTQSTTLSNDVTNPFPSGNMHIATVYPPPPPPSNTAPAGTIMNQWPGMGVQTADPSPANPNGALDLAGNANLQSDKSYCFNIGAINTTNQTNVTLSFAIASFGNGGQFDFLTLAYSTTGAPGTFTHAINNSILVPIVITQNGMYNVLTEPLDTGANNQSTLYIQFCFSGAANNANGNDTLIDNIQVTSQGPAVPEPTTAISGVLAVVGLCWCQRRRLIGFLQLRRA
jgi:hypothetical protein